MYYHHEELLTALHQQYLREDFKMNIEKGRKLLVFLAAAALLLGSDGIITAAGPAEKSEQADIQ